MNYQQHVKEMMSHLDDNFTQEGFGEFLHATTTGIAAMIASRMPDHDQMHAFVESLCIHMNEHACRLHVIAYGKQSPSPDQHKAPEVLQ